MDSVRSYLRDGLPAARTMVGTLSALNKDLGDVLKRVNSDPGLPVPNPTDSFWREDTLYPKLVNIGLDCRTPPTLSL